MTNENENGTENNNENTTPATPETTTPAVEPTAPEAAAPEVAAPETTPVEATTEATATEVPPADPKTVKVTFNGASTQTVEIAAGSKLAAALDKAGLSGGYSYRLNDKAAYGTTAINEDVSVNVVAKSRAA